VTIACSCRGLAAGWNDELLVSGLDLDAEFTKLNQCLPIVGRTGVGKSTLLYILSGMAVPSAGSVSWQLPIRDGTGAPQWEKLSWSGETSRAFAAAARPRPRKFGFLLQDAAMLPCFTVEENLRHSMRLRGVPGDDAAVSARIRSAVTAMLIDDEDVDRLLHVYPAHLSGGQRQRMGLAAATVHDPAVLFADEPTASLDDETGVQVLTRVRQWLDDAPSPGERSFVFVTHRLDIIKSGLRAPKLLRLRKHSKSDRQSKSDKPTLTFEWEPSPG
jgi:ABC-type lipoprotein export system ATPase subunit